MKRQEKSYFSQSKIRQISFSVSSSSNSVVILVTFGKKPDVTLVLSLYIYVWGNLLCAFHMQNVYKGAMLQNVLNERYAGHHMTTGDAALLARIVSRIPRHAAASNHRINKANPNHLN